jgi:hypothetical protein
MNDAVHRAGDARRTIASAFHWRASLKLALPGTRAAPGVEDEDWGQDVLKTDWNCKFQPPFDWQMPPFILGSARLAD